MKKEIDIGTHIRNELTEYGVEDSKIAEIVRIIEREDEPAPAPEPVRLWCAKDCKCGKRGHIYEQVGNQIKLEYDYHSHTRTYEEFCSWNESVAPYFFPLLHRPAKEGEWARLKGKTGLAVHHRLNEGDVFKVVSAIPDGTVTVKHGGQHIALVLPEYDVISGYHGEYETCPTCGKMGEK